MAFSVFQSGATLYAANSTGSQAALTLPTGVTVGTNRPRFITSGNFAICVNSPSRPVTVDANLNVRVLTPKPPITVPTLTGAAGGTLSGTFKVKQTFVIRDAF